MRFVERTFEATLWNSRFVVLFAVVASIVSGIAIVYMATVDVVYLLNHLTHYADASMAADVRKAMRDDAITHIVEVVDGYLLATVMLIFGLGLYELFISDIEAARHSRTSAKILVIENLDDLKNRLAKVILMILIVKLFEHALKMKLSDALDLLYLGGSIALVGLALYLGHASESGHGAAAAQETQS